MNILVIEDEKKIAHFIKNGLKEEGYAVDVCYDGETGLNHAQINEYDLLVVDLMLPKIDGLTLCKNFRKENTTTPILILTARSSIQDKVTGLDSGANDYLTKPFAFEEFLARIRALLRVKTNAVSNKLKYADLSMDLLTHTVKRGTKDISLTTKEFSLLEYLLRNAETVVTRTMISEHVWGVDFETFTNSIDVYINYLRNKIDHGFDKKLIHTLRGRGYILKK
jgi:DNA-binding response OmpR family regulator